MKVTLTPSEVAALKAIATVLGEKNVDDKAIRKALHAAITSATTALAADAEAKQRRRN